MSIDKATEILEFKKELANAEEKEALDFALSALDFVKKSLFRDWETCKSISLQNPMFEYEGKVYIGENLVLKTIDKDNICSFYGFREVKEND